MLATRLLLCAFCVAGTVSGQATEDAFSSGVKVMYRALGMCEGSDLVTCLKVRTLKSIDRILKQDEVTIVDGVTFQKITSEDERRGDNGRGIEETQLNEVDEKSLPEDPAKREEAVDQLLMQRLITFIGTRSLKVNMPKLIEDTVFTGRGQGGFGGGKGGGGGGGKKGGGGLILVMGMLAGGLGAMALKTIALIAGKALITAKVALVIAAVIGLSKLVHKEHTTTYEIVKHPKVSHHNTYSSSHEFIGGHGGGGGGGGGDYEVLGGGGGGHYGRSLQDFHSHFLAFNSQIPRNEKDTSEIKEVETNDQSKQ